jgi:hypothetical protein
LPPWSAHEVLPQGDGHGLMEEYPPSRPSVPEDPAMPKPVPIPVRRKLLQRAQQGESTASLAAAFGLAPRTVRHLRKRFRDRGPDGVTPDYRAPRRLPQAYPGQVREPALALRRQHPSWGAVLIRVALGQRRPKVAWPCSSTLPAGQEGHHAPPDLADRCLGTDRLGRRHSGLLAAGRRRGQRRRPGDDDFPPEPSGARSILGPPKKPCARCSHTGACPSD